MCAVPVFDKSFPAPGNLDSLTIGIFNVNELKRQATGFRTWAYSNNLDIRCQFRRWHWAHSSQGNVSKIVNYKLFNVDRVRRSSKNRTFGDTDIFVKRRFNITSIYIPTVNCIEITPVILDFLHIPKRLTSAIYVPPLNGRNLLEHNLLIIFKILLLRVILMQHIPLGTVDLQMNLVSNSKYG